MNERRWLPARAAGLILVALGAAVLFTASPAVAAAESDVTWSVTPATPDGPDGRGVIQQELDPGEVRQDYFAIKNLSRSEVTFSLNAADGYYTERGRFTMLPSTRESVGAGRWIDVPERVTVAPSATVVVPFTTRVPNEALPGDHAAGIAASVLSAGTDASGSEVGVESRVGFRVMTRVSGDIVAAYEVVGGDTSYATSWHPFEPGAARVTFQVRNTGNASLVIGGQVRAGTGVAAFPGTDATRQEVLPGESRTLTIAVPGVWPTVFVPGAVTLAPTGHDLGGASVAVAESTTSITMWAIPLPQLIALTGVALILAAATWRRRRFRAAIAAAHEEGRAAASGDAARPAPARESALADSRRSRRMTPAPPDGRL